jgi:hypothetical protein
VCEVLQCWVITSPSSRVAFRFKTLENKMNRSRSFITKLGILKLGILLLVSFSASAQAQQDGVITINGGKNTVLMKPWSTTITPAQPLSPELITIYSTLGTGKNVYNAGAGNGIVGPDAGQLYPEWIGNAFRAKADHIVTVIQVGATYVNGGNAVVLSLNADANNRPGKALGTWHFANLPQFGSCCTLLTAKSKVGIKVKKGSLYWVVMETTPQHRDTYAVWNNDWSGLQGVWTNDIGSGSEPASHQQLNAFGVFGK